MVEHDGFEPARNLKDATNIKCSVFAMFPKITLLDRFVLRGQTYGARTSESEIADATQLFRNRPHHDHQTVLEASHRNPSMRSDGEAEVLSR